MNRHRLLHDWALPLGAGWAMGLIFMIGWIEPVPFRPVVPQKPGPREEARSKLKAMRAVVTRVSRKPEAPPPEGGMWMLLERLRDLEVNQPGLLGLGYWNRVRPRLAVDPWGNILVPEASPPEGGILMLLKLLRDLEINHPELLGPEYWRHASPNPTVDFWGNDLIYELETRQQSAEGGPARFVHTLRLYSVGPNGIDEKMQGDDIGTQWTITGRLVTERVTEE